MSHHAPAEQTTNCRACYPALVTLEPPQRLRLMRVTFQKFFPWVWTAVLLLLASGYSMVFMVFGGFANAGLHVHLMQGIGWLMIALFVWLFHGPWLAFKSAVDAEDWPKAGTSLERIRQIISINLPLGLISFSSAPAGAFGASSQSKDRSATPMRSQTRLKAFSIVSWISADGHTGFPSAKLTTR